MKKYNKDIIEDTLQALIRSLQTNEIIIRIPENEAKLYESYGFKKVDTEGQFIKLIYKTTEE